MSRVAIIIPTFNRAHLIGDAIESALAQTCGDSEIIVVDDGSTDNTAEVVASYGDPIRYLWQPNAGKPAEARNRGISATRAEYLVFLDSDDVLLPTKVARQVEFLDSHPEFDFVFGNCLYMDEHGHTIPGASAYTRTCWTGDASLPELLRGNFIPVVAPLVRRSALDRVGIFDPNIRPEDYDLWLRIAATGSFAGTDDVVAKIRLGPARRSVEQLEIIRGYIRVFEKFRAQFPNVVQRHQALFRRRLSQIHLSLGIVLHDSGRRSAALGAFRSALAIDPSNPHVYLRLSLLAFTPRQVLALKQARAAVSERYPRFGRARGRA